MSNDVVIKKSLADKIDKVVSQYANYDSYLFTKKDLEALRDAPETVSLEGLKTRQFWIEDDDYAKPHVFAEVSDLQCLVAPVQSGSVVKEFLEWLLYGKCGTVVVAEKAREALSHLTTQSAPSVGSVPSILELEQVILPIWYGDSKGKPYEISNAIRALLTSRMEPKL